MKPRRSNNIVAKTAHKLYSPSRVASDVLTGNMDNTLEKVIGSDKDAKKYLKAYKASATTIRGAAAVSSIKRGYDAQRLRESGETEEERKKNKKEAAKKNAKGLALSTAVILPTLVSEGAASRKGIKLLKESGASKKYIKDSKKHLKHAFNTYATYYGNIPVKDAAGQIAGTGLYKVKHKNKKKEKE